MVAEFLRVAGANSVPSIGEYGILPDKVTSLHFHWLH